MKVFCGGLISKGANPYSVITGFKFMANKQFRMEEKKMGKSVCADISHYALKNQYVLFL